MNIHYSVHETCVHETCVHAWVFIIVHAVTIDILVIYVPMFGTVCCNYFDHIFDAKHAVVAAVVWEINPNMNINLRDGAG